MSDFNRSRPGAGENGRTDGVSGARRQSRNGKAAMTWSEQEGRRRRAAASLRMEPLSCGCRDSEAHHCKPTRPVVIEGRPLDAWAAARAHLRAAGLEPIIPAAAARLLDQGKAA